MHTTVYMHKMCIYQEGRTSPEPVTNEMAVQIIIAGFRLHKGPHLGDSGGNEPPCGSPQLLGVRSVSVILFHM